MNRFLAAACFLISGQLMAQPLSVTEHLPPVGDAAIHTISGYNPAVLEAADNATYEGTTLMNIGRLFDAGITPQNGGEWQAVANGRVWRWKVTAESAKGILFLGKVKYMADGTTLTLSGKDGENSHTYTAADFANNNILSGKTIKGTEALVEYFEPTGTNHLPDFVIEKIGYIYRDEAIIDFRKSGFGSAGACQVNVNCSEGDNFKNQRNSVVRIRIVNDWTILWGSGAMVNNTRQDFKPYLLSAQHIGLSINQKELIHDSLFDYWTFQFNFQGPGCPNPPDPTGIDTQFIVGAKVLAHSNDTGGEWGSDFLLMELSQHVPIEFNAYYAGWDRDTSEQFIDGVSIHHPSGDIKKISSYTWPLTKNAPYSTSPDKTHWQVLWSQTTNGYGVTEGGSSGSPIFSKEGYIVGTLTGGRSKCNTPTELDAYGRFDWHWHRNGNDSSRRLKEWLDPENKNPTKLDGAYEWPASVEEISEKLPLLLYPNPAKDIITYKHPMLTNSATQNVSVVNILGQEMVVNTGNPQIIDISHLPSGIYFVLITEKGNLFAGKFIKE